MGLFKRSTSDTEAKTIEWPRLNELIWIRLPCCETAIHPSRVEGAEGEFLVVAHPSKPHQNPVPPPPPNKMFLIGWREGTGSKQVRVKLHSSAEGEVPTWTLKAETEPEIVQRRRFVRTEWNAEILLYLPMQTIKGKIYDFSEGGLRCAIPAMKEPFIAFFRVSFTLEEEPLVLDAEVAWWGTPVGDTVQVGLQFVDHSTQLADRLRSFVFSRQLEGRRDRQG